MVDTFTLTGNLRQTLGGKVSGARATLHLNTADGAYVNPVDHDIYLPGDVIPLTAEQTFSIELPSSTATDLQYEIRIEYSNDRTPGKWRSGWFDMVADTTLAERAEESSPTAAVAPASAYALEAKGYRDEAALIVGLTGEDEAVALLVGDDGSETAQALSATIAAQVPINPLHYGAAGNGSTDDTAAFQAAVDACPVGGVVDGRGKTYVVTSVNFKSDMELRNTYFKTKAGSANNVSPVTIGAYGDTTTRQNITFRNVHVNGNRKNQTSISATEGGGRHGFRILGPVVNLTLEDCSATYCASDGICLYRGTGMSSIQSYNTGIKRRIRLTRCRFNYNRRHGLSGDTLTDFHATDVEFNYNGINVDGGAVEGDQGELSAGNIYANGVDLEEMDIKDYVGDVHFTRCRAIGNAKSGWLCYQGASILANDANYVTRKGFTWTDCDGDAGVGPTAEGMTISLTPSNPNKALGTYFDDVEVVNCRITSVTARSVGQLRHQGGVAAGYNGYIGIADRVTDLQVKGVSSPEKAYFLDSSTAKYLAWDRPLIVPAGAFLAAGGTPTGSVINRHPCWLLSDAETDILAAQVVIPVDWAKVDVYVHWVNASAAAGAVKMVAGLSSEIAGGTLATASTGFVTPTAAAQNVVTATRVRQAITVTPGALTNIEINREAGAGSDTLAGDIALLAVTLVRA